MKKMDSVKMKKYGMFVLEYTVDDRMAQYFMAHTDKCYGFEFDSGAKGSWMAHDVEPTGDGETWTATVTVITGTQSAWEAMKAFYGEMYKYSEMGC